MFEKILSFLGISYDLTENLRKTEVDTKDNKESLRNYEFQDEDFSKPPTSRKEYKKNKINQSNKKIENKVANERDDR